MLSSFRQACVIGFVGSGMDAMCLRGRLPQKGPSFVHTLRGFSVPVSLLLSPTMTFPCRSPGFDCCCNFAWGLTPFQWSEAGLLGQPSLGTCAGAHSVALGLQGMSGISCLIALILPMFAASSGHFFDDADGTMQLFFWHTNQKAVCHCLTAILGLADDSNSDMSS